MEDNHSDFEFREEAIPFVVFNPKKQGKRLSVLGGKRVQRVLRCFQCMILMNLNVNCSRKNQNSNLMFRYMWFTKFEQLSCLFCTSYLISNG